MKAVLVISDRDNVATALESLQPGRTVDVRGAALPITDPIPPGHKVALQPIPAGADVIKYGSPIGTALQAIAPGQHVHTHNVASSRGRGDLGAIPLRQGPGEQTPPEPEARLAEPPEGASSPPAPPPERKKPA